MSENKAPFRIINFNKAYEAPKYTWNKSKSFITWGKDNNYPQYLINLYNYTGSSKHKMIIDKKIRYISGQGFEDILDTNLKSFVTKTNLTEEITKATYDYELFNGFAFEVIWSNDGSTITSVKHMPISQLRMGIMNDDIQFPYFWYSKDWSNMKNNTPQPILEYNPLVPSGKQIYFYWTYNPDNILVKYPIPTYSTCINSIETDYEIGKFHLNQAKQGYAPSFILNFATGIPTTEEQDEFYNYFEANYSGTENAGKALITYSEDETGKPTFLKVDLNDSDERFIMLSERIENDIVQGSSIPPQMVILTPGKLGSTEERAALMKEFQQDYISPRQNVLENNLNRILSVNGYTETLILKKYAL